MPPAFGFGVRVLRFHAWDLQNTHDFWRLVTAIAVGAEMLVTSYTYQRRGVRPRS